MTTEKCSLDFYVRKTVSFYHEIYYAVKSNNHYYIINQDKGKKQIIYRIAQHDLVAKASALASLRSPFQLPRPILLHNGPQNYCLNPGHCNKFSKILSYQHLDDSDESLA